MLPGCMPRNQIQQHMHPPLMYLIKQPLQIRIGPISRRHFHIVRDIISRIQKRRRKARIQPDRITSQFRYIVQMLDDPLDISDPIRIAIRKRLRIDLIKNRIFQPLNHTRLLLSLTPFPICLMANGFLRIFIKEMCLLHLSRHFRRTLCQRFLG